MTRQTKRRPQRRELPSEVRRVIASDKPVMIAGCEVPCYVLDDKTRVLSQRGFLKAIGRSPTPPGVLTTPKTRVDNLPVFLAANNLQPFIDGDFSASTTRIEFFLESGRSLYGYEAKLLPEVCKVYLRARRSGKLLPSQKHIAERAEVVLDHIATDGIVELVDQATGYDEARLALARYLEEWIAKSLQPWVKTFPFEFYELIYGLQGWGTPRPDHRFRQVVGRFTLDIVYSRLAPGILEEVLRKTPRYPDGQLVHKLHQWFTPDYGHIRLREHIFAVMALMRAVETWPRFLALLNKSFPVFTEDIGQMELDLQDRTERSGQEPLRFRPRRKR